MENKLSLRHYVYIGSMLFGLFFGAGNLIFPVHLGQEAGSHIFLANLGFLITGIGLPFLGVIAMGLSKSNGVFELATRVSRRYALFFTILLYLTIGPFFALPRLATTSFEIGILPFIPQKNYVWVLALFSILFFSIAWYLSRKPSKLLEYIGKILNPFFLLLLFLLFLFAFINPMGVIHSAPVSESYVSNPFFKGFTEGYNTLDTLASLSFGILIVSNIRQLGVTNPKTIAKDTVKSGAFGIGLMGIIYTLLAYMGVYSLGKFSLSDNGGIALSQIAHFYLGSLGNILLAVIVLLACLKTAIGLLTACSEMFHELFPKKSYHFYLCIFSIMPCLFANVGLTNIIQYSVPVLMFLYPLSMTLIFLVILSPLFHHRQVVYKLTIAITTIFSTLDALNNMPESAKNFPLIQEMLSFSTHYIPLFSIGMGWVFPSFIAFIVSLGYLLLKKQKKD